jgi:hypothetical protein
MPDSAGNVRSLEHGYTEPLSQEVSGSADTADAGADDGYRPAGTESMVLLI